MTELDFESDAFLSLLSDALRAGPGSPSWHDALQRLRAGGIQHADEYRLLVTAREHLESGKSYRSVRAGPGFTKKLLSAIEQEPGRAPRTSTPTATLVAFLCAGGVLATIVAIGYLLMTAADKPPATPDGTVLLTNTVADNSFNDKLPSDWRKIGSLPVAFTRSTMRYGPTTAESSATGGGTTWTQPIAPEEPFAVVAGVRVNRIEENLITQVFVTDQPDFSDDSATTPHELVWLLQSNQSQVILPSGRIENRSDQPKDLHGVMNVRITIDKDQATVDLGTKRLWSGPHGLDPLKPRYIGVRFLKRSGDAGDGVVFQSVRVNMRQKP